MLGISNTAGVDGDNFMETGATLEPDAHLAAHNPPWGWRRQCYRQFEYKQDWHHIHHHTDIGVTLAPMWATAYSSEQASPIHNAGDNPSEVLTLWSDGEEWMRQHHDGCLHQLGFNPAPCLALLATIAGRLELLFNSVPGVAFPTPLVLVATIPWRLVLP